MVRIRKKISDGVFTLVCNSFDFFYGEEQPTIQFRRKIGGRELLEAQILGFHEFPVCPFVLICDPI